MPIESIRPLNKPESTFPVRFHLDAQQLYSPCVSKEDLRESIANMATFVRHKTRGQQWLRATGKVGTLLGPYLGVGNTLVS